MRRASDHNSLKTHQGCKILKVRFPAPDLKGLAAALDFLKMKNVARDAIVLSLIHI